MLHYKNHTTVLHFHWVFSTLSSSKPFGLWCFHDHPFLPLNHDRHHVPRARLPDPAKFFCEKTVIFSKEKKSQHKKWAHKDSIFQRIPILASRLGLFICCCSKVLFVLCWMQGTRICFKEGCTASGDVETYVNSMGYCTLSCFPVWRKSLHLWFDQYAKS